MKLKLKIIIQCCSLMRNLFFTGTPVRRSNSQGDERRSSFSQETSQGSINQRDPFPSRVASLSQHQESQFQRDQFRTGTSQKRQLSQFDSSSQKTSCSSSEETNIRNITKFDEITLRSRHTDICNKLNAIENSLNTSFDLTAKREARTADDFKGYHLNLMNELKNFSKSISEIENAQKFLAESVKSASQLAISNAESLAQLSDRFRQLSSRRANQCDVSTQADLSSTQNNSSNLANSIISPLFKTRYSKSSSNGGSDSESDICPISVTEYMAMKRQRISQCDLPKSNHLISGGEDCNHHRKPLEREGDKEYLHNSAQDTSKKLKHADQIIAINKIHSMKSHCSSGEKASLQVYEKNSTVVQKLATIENAIPASIRQNVVADGTATKEKNLLSVVGGSEDCNHQKEREGDKTNIPNSVPQASKKSKHADQIIAINKIYSMKPHCSSREKASLQVIDDLNVGPNSVTLENPTPASIRRNVSADGTATKEKNLLSGVRLPQPKKSPNQSVNALKQAEVPQEKNLRIPSIPSSRSIHLDINTASMLPLSEKGETRENLLPISPISVSEKKPYSSNISKPINALAATPAMSQKESKKSPCQTETPSVPKGDKSVPVLADTATATNEKNYTIAESSRTRISNEGPCNQSLPKEAIPAPCFTMKLIMNKKVAAEQSSLACMIPQNLREKRSKRADSWFSFHKHLYYPVSIVPIGDIAESGDVVETLACSVTVTIRSELSTDEEDPEEFKATTRHESGVYWFGAIESVCVSGRIINQQQSIQRGFHPQNAVAVKTVVPGQHRKSESISSVVSASNASTKSPVVHEPLGNPSIHHMNLVSQSDNNKQPLTSTTPSSLLASIDHTGDRKEVLKTLDAPVLENPQVQQYPYAQLTVDAANNNQCQSAQKALLKDGPASAEAVVNSTAADRSDKVTAADSTEFRESVIVQPNNSDSSSRSVTNIFEAERAKTSEDPIIIQKNGDPLQSEAIIIELPLGCVSPICTVETPAILTSNNWNEGAQSPISVLSTATEQQLSYAEGQEVPVKEGMIVADSTEALTCLSDDETCITPVIKITL